MSPNPEMLITQPPVDPTEGGDAIASTLDGGAIGFLDIFHGYMGVLLIAFLVSLCATPILRRIAINVGVIDHPNDPRKQHKFPVAYLGGAAVFVGLLAGVTLSYFNDVIPSEIYQSHSSQFDQRPFPLSILLGMTLIMLAGLVDDIVGLDPRLKVSGQLLAAAALAMDDIGVKVAKGVLEPIGSYLFNNSEMVFSIGGFELDVIYWAGTGIIAIFVLGGCNASNLIDGLDGLLSGVTAVAAFGFLFIALALAAADDGPLDSTRIILCMALLGACLGFLPHNFNPATIFLGDCGSLLLGFCSIVIVLSLGDTGRTPLVIAGLLIYGLPIIDTTLAIVRRKLAGLPMSAADSNHLHHQLKRALGVKGAVFVLYGIGASFAVLGVALTLTRARVVYALAIIVMSFILVTAIKIARMQAIHEQTAGRVRRAATASSESGGKADADKDPAPDATAGVSS